jgi:CysZ protein
MKISNISFNLFSILKDKSTYKYIIPGALVTLIYASFLWSMGWFGDTSTVSSDNLSWSAKILFWLTSGVKWFTTMLFEFVVITLFSPIMAMLSEHVETSLTGEKFVFSISRFVRELLRTLGILFTGFLFSALVMLIWALISWIGDLSKITPYIVFVIKAFFIGFNFMDYSLERHQVSVGKSWVYGLNRPVQMLLTGAFFSLFFAIPVLGVMLAPFLTTILATLVWVESKASDKK